MSQRLPSGKFFYYNPVSGNRVMQSFQDDTWRGENNNGLCLVTATNAQDVMRILDGDCAALAAAKE